MGNVTSTNAYHWQCDQDSWVTIWNSREIFVIDQFLSPYTRPSPNWSDHCLLAKGEPDQDF